MNNIFENAYFGKPYKTRDGRKAIFLRTFVCNGYKHYVSTGELEYSVREDGKVDKNLYPYEEDIISEWQEPINDDELDKLAWKEYPDDDDDDTPLNGIDNYELREAFKAGYRKDKEE